MPQPIRLKDHEKDARLVRRRVVVGGVVVLLLTCVLIARMYYLQVIQYEHHTTLAENNRIHVQPIPPTRGLIFDRNGVIIADNRPSFSLTITRERAGDWRQVLDAIVEVLELTPDDRALFEKRMRQGRRPFEPVPVLFELSEEQIARIAVNQFRLPGVEVVACWRREQEHTLRARGPGGMDDAALARFLPAFERLTRHALATLPARADAVLSLDAARRPTAWQRRDA